VTVAVPRKRPGVGVFATHRIARANTASNFSSGPVAVAELRKQPGDIGAKLTQSAHNVRNYNFTAAKLFDVQMELRRTAYIYRAARAAPLPPCTSRRTVQAITKLLGNSLHINLVVLPVGPSVRH
jgi:hypothetical protein